MRPMSDATSTLVLLRHGESEWNAKHLFTGWVDVDLTVVTHARSERKLVRFKMEPSLKRQDEFIFLPTEIINNIGKSPENWQETGWD